MRAVRTLLGLLLVIGCNTADLTGGDTGGGDTAVKPDGLSFAVDTPGAGDGADGADDAVGPTDAGDEDVPGVDGADGIPGADVETDVVAAEEVGQEDDVVDGADSGTDAVAEDVGQPVSPCTTSPQSAG